MQVTKKIFQKLFLAEIVFSLSLVTVTTVGAREIVKDYMQSDFEVRVNNRLFSRQIEVINGVRAERYQVDDKPVSADIFEDQLVSAESAERRLELKHENEMIGNREREEQLTRIAATKKLLKQLVDRLRRDLSLLEKFTLERYFVFSPETLTREEYEQVVTQLIPASLKAIAAGDALGTSDQLYQDLEAYERRVNAFVFATIRQAIDRCDDPKLLKELLAVVS